MQSTAKYRDTDLRHEINGVLDRLAASGEVMRPAWVTHEICRAHRAGLSDAQKAADHVAFWEFGGYTITRKLATECINDRDTALEDDTAEPAQRFLPYDGYERTELQDMYVFTREGEDVGVPTREATNAELRGKAALYRKQSARLLAHADDIDRYVDWRDAQRSEAHG